MTDEILQQASEVRQQVDEMLAIPAREVERAERARRTALRFHVATVVLILAGIIGVAAIAYDNSRTTKNLVVPLQERNAELTEQVADLEVVVGQAVAGIQLQNQMLRDAGVEPPEIVLLPPEDGD